MYSFVPAIRQCACKEWMPPDVVSSPPQRSKTAERTWILFETDETRGVQRSGCGPIFVGQREHTRLAIRVLNDQLLSWPDHRLRSSQSAVYGTCQLIGIIISPAEDLAHRTPSSFSAVLKKYCVESPRDMTRARMMSPGRRDFTTSALSTSVARISW